MSSTVFRVVIQMTVPILIGTLHINSVICGMFLKQLLVLPHNSELVLASMVCKVFPKVIESLITRRFYEQDIAGKTRRPEKISCNRYRDKLQP